MNTIVIADVPKRPPQNNDAAGRNLVQFLGVNVDELTGP
jgi:hypothetical protein